MSDARWCWTLFAAASLARLVASLGAVVFGTDSCHYLLMADWMREGRFHDALLVAYHPMYPLLIAIARSFCASSEQAGSLVSVVLGSAAAVPMFLSARTALGRPAAVIGTLLYAFQPAIVEVQSDVMTEGTYMFFLASTMWLTQRMIESPSLERGVPLGLAAAFAFLTRPEGLLALAVAALWPLLDLLRRRRQPALRLGGVAVAVAVMILALSPFLLWVRAERGRWGLSIRPSAIAAEQAVGVRDPGSTEGSSEGKGRLLRIFGMSVLHLSLYGALVPFYVLGAAQLRHLDRQKAVYYLSVPVGHLGGLLFALREHTFMSERYVMPGMALLGALAGLGIARVLPGVFAPPPGRVARPVLGGAVLLLLLLVPYARCLKVRRAELRSYPDAGRWILTQGKKPSVIVGLEQVAYYAGCRSYYAPTEREALERFLSRQPVDYIVYSDKDVAGRPGYVRMLGAMDLLEPVLTFAGPPGTWKVYFHRVKRAP